MSELTTGQGAFPENWGFPSMPYNYCTGEYTPCGMIWYGDEPATILDVLEVLDARHSSGTIDRLSLCGTDDPAWTTKRDVLLATNPGGCYKPSYG